MAPLGPLVRDLTAPGHQPAASSPPPTVGQRTLPRPGWPAKDDLDYTKTLIELAVLLLAVPWLLKRLATNPKAASRKAAQKQIG